MWSRFVERVAQRSPLGFRQLFPKKNDRIIIAMSGGVDSSLAAALYASQYKVQGIFMQNWSQAESGGCLEQDWKDVCKIGSFLGIPVERVNFEKDYWLDVFEPMLAGYAKGVTPNPDIGCNRFVKFGALTRYLDEKYGDYWLVTGHYSRVLEGEQGAALLKAFYKNKDQSYYLSQVDPARLPRLLMPMGHLTKPEVRELAQDILLPTADKPDSQGICFVNHQGVKFKEFLSQYLLDQPGNIVTDDGQVWGKHRGIWSYTIGQKSSVEMPQGDPRYKGQWFVSKKDLAKNEITIVNGRDNPALYKSRITCEDVTGTRLADATHIQFRSLMEPAPLASVVVDGTTVHVELEEEQRAIAPGQYLCFYQGEVCLGSGVITGVHK